MAAKIISGNINYVLALYELNVLVVGANIVVYFRNKRLDEEAEAAARRPQ